MSSLNFSWGAVGMMSVAYRTLPTFLSFSVSCHSNLHFISNLAWKSYYKKQLSYCTFEAACFFNVLLCFENSFYFPKPIRMASCWLAVERCMDLYGGIVTIVKCNTWCLFNFKSMRLHFLNVNFEYFVLSTTVRHTKLLWYNITFTYNIMLFIYFWSLIACQEECNK